MSTKSDITKGLAAGVAGGLVASLVMNQFQALLHKLMEGESRSHGAQSMQQGLPDHGVSRELQKRGSDDPKDNAAVRTGNAVAEFGFNQKLTKPEKEVAGAIAHYAMGVTSGAIYGAVAELVPLTTAVEGLPFGAAVWVSLAANEAYTPGGANHLATLSTMENLVGTGNDDSLIGDGNANRLDGAAGNDLLIGGAGATLSYITR